MSTEQPLGPPGIVAAFDTQLHALTASVHQLLSSDRRSEANVIARLGDDVDDFSKQLHNVRLRLHLLLQDYMYRRD